MGKIVLDPELRHRLHDLGEQMEVCDEAGRTVGLFLPLEKYQHLLEMLRIPLADDEIDRRKAEQAGSSLSEFWERMGRQ